MSDPFKKPLSSEEIEGLLRTAREREQSDVVSSEPLGPGDVQHLRNTPPEKSELLDTAWPYDSVSTDELLHRVEHNLAAAMGSGMELHPAGTGAAEFRPYQFQPLESVPPTSGATSLPISAIGDIELDISLELGHAEMTIEDLIALREGSVVPLDKLAGEPIDILANGRLIARGEVIVIDDKFCVRICEVITPR